MTDKETGKKLFYSFYKWQKSFYPTKINYSFDSFLNMYGKKKDLYLDGLGGMIREAAVSDSRIESAMRSLASDSKGKILANPIKMSNYIQNQEIQIDWIDAVAFVAVESVKDVAKGAQSVGNQLLLTGKILNFLLPFVALIFLYSWVNKKTGVFNK